MPKWALSQIYKTSSVLKINHCDPPYEQATEEIPCDYILHFLLQKKIIHPVMLKTLKLGTEVNSIILIKSIYKNLTTYIIYYINVFPLTSRTRQEGPLSSLLYVTGSSSHCSKARKKTKGPTVWKRKNESVPLHR